MILSNLSEIYTSSFPFWNIFYIYSKQSIFLFLQYLFYFISNLFYLLFFLLRNPIVSDFSIFNINLLYKYLFNFIIVDFMVFIFSDINIIYIYQRFFLFQFNSSPFPFLITSSIIKRLNKVRSINILTFLFI